MTSLRTACASPKVHLADPDENKEEIAHILDELAEKEIDLALFPELSLTGASLGDLYREEALLSRAKEALFDLAALTKKLRILYFVGLPVKVEGKIYSAMAGIYKGRVEVLLGRTSFPAASFYDFHRVFQPLKDPTLLSEELVFLPSGALFTWAEVKMSLFFESDLKSGWRIDLAQAQDADLLLIPAAAPWKLGAAEKRERDLKALSGRGFGLLYASAGLGESTTDQVFSAEKYLIESGKTLKKSALIGSSQEREFWTKDREDIYPLLEESGISLCSGNTWASHEAQEENSPRFDLIFTDFDLDRIRIDRQKEIVQKGRDQTKEERFLQSSDKENPVGSFALELCEGSSPRNHQKPLREINPLPFVPDQEEDLQDILTLQALGLCTRMQAAGAQDLWIGLSGGLDSTLALLVCLRAAEMLGLDRKKIHAVTLPSYGTSDKTHDNAWKLGRSLGIDFREIPIHKAMEVHFKDIGLAEGDHSVAFENAQARERTQILFDLANLYGGILVGTGDLSEIALGWSTYNGDHISSYGVNQTIPKTLVRALVRSEAKRISFLKDLFLDIIDTPVSPELLPAEKGKISQETEKIIGPYELHDFFLYYFIGYGFGPRKLYDYARAAFPTEDEKEILRTMAIFFKRFFSSQFKRSCSVDGPSIGILSLSPRGGWQMPSDAKGSVYAQEIDQMKKECSELPKGQALPFLW